MRELISESTMYKVLLGSNSKISKKFKNDVANILVELRKDGQLKVTNKEITLQKNNQPIVQKYKDPSYPLYYRDNKRYTQFIDKLINFGKKIVINKYNRYCIY